MGSREINAVVVKVLSEAVHDNRFAIAILIALVGLFAATRRATPLPARVLGVAEKTSFVLIAATFLMATSYLFVPNFIDRIESDVLVTSFNWLHGLPIHPDWKGPNGAYGIIYGPLLNEFYGWPLIFSLSPTVIKLMPYLCFCGTVAILSYFALRRDKRQNNRAISLAYIMIMLWFSPLIFWARCEPLLLLLGATACLALDKLPKVLAVSAAGVLAGLASAMKIHAVAYFIPVLFMYVSESSLDIVYLFKYGVLFSVMWLISFLVPYGFSPENLAGHWRYLRAVAAHGISIRILVHNILAAICIVGPLVAIRYFGPADVRTKRWTLVFLVWTICVLAVSFVAASPGSGTYHLLPFIPFCLYVATRTPAPAAPKVSVVLLWASIVVAIAPVAATGWTLLTFQRSAKATLAAQNEALALARLYPGAEFGPSDGDDDSIARLTDRFAALADGSVQKFGLAEWLDLDAGGVKPEDAWIFQDCHTKAWIIPNEGQPFTVTSAYTSRPVFPEAFRAQFFKTHAVVMRGTTYSVWKCLN